MSYKFNPFTGNFDLVNPPTQAVGPTGSVQLSDGAGNFTSGNLFLNGILLGVNTNIPVGMITAEAPPGANIGLFTGLSSIRQVTAAITSNDVTGDGIFDMSRNSESSPEFTVRLHTNGNSYIAGGALGVGNTTPLAQLHVTGNMIIDGGGQLNMSSQLITNLGTPLLGTDAANKDYVDTNFVASTLLGVANGVATLNASGKLNASQVPGIAITDTFVVNSQAAMLALSTAETGDVAVRTDVFKSFILAGTNPAVLADWQELLTPASPVQSVNGQVGTVVLNSDNIAEGVTNFYYTAARFNAAFSAKTTTDLAEGTNLYYTAARFNGAFSSKTTSDLTEGTNLYYTQARFDSALAAKSTTNLAEGTNLYYTQARFDTAFSAKSTTNLTEGANLYYTAARFDTAFATKTTTDLAEGSNLYFTNSRAQSAITGAASTIVTANLTASRALVSDVSGKVATSAVTSAELGFVSGVTSAIQTQLDAKQATITGAATTIVTSNLTASRALSSDVSGKVAVATTTLAELNFLSGVTSAVQTQLDSKQATITGAATTITSSNLTASRAVSSDASGKIAVATTTLAELNFLSGVTSAVQTQLDAKQATITGAATTITSSNLTASRAVVSDVSGKVAVSAVTSAELGFVSGVTSAIQTQIDSKQATITGAATTITSANLTASRAVVSDGSGKVAVSAVTSAELGFVSGVTSSIQTQIDTKAARLTVVNVAANVTLAANTIVLTDTTAARTLTLPTGQASGTIICIKDATGTSVTNPITITRGGSAVIDGAISITIASGYGAEYLVTDGINWFRI